MNEDIKRKWVEALRSGQYEQGRNILSGGDGTGGWRHCCLGVLCELAVEEGVTTSQERVPGNMMVIDGGIDVIRVYGTYGGGNSATLPSEVAQWAGLGVGSPTVLYKGRNTQLVTINDEEGASFDEIADLIEGTPAEGGNLQ